MERIINYIKNDEEGKYIVMTNVDKIYTRDKILEYIKENKDRITDNKVINKNTTRLIIINDISIYLPVKYNV